MGPVATVPAPNMILSAMNWRLMPYISAWRKRLSEKGWRPPFSSIHCMVDQYS
ncbi:hypothetical protein D3C85_1147970 [compost metagenome]